MLKFLTKTAILLMISILLASSASADPIDTKILNFEKKRLSKNKRIKIKDISIHIKKKLGINGWYGYVFNVKAEISGKTVEAKDIIFTNGSVVAPELNDIYTGKSYKSILNPKLDAKYYNQKHLIAGKSNAKHKLVIFSDPLCPFCIEYVPEVIKDVKANPDKLALYYYHFPLLSIHPAADIVTKAMHVANEKGLKDVELKVYTAEFENDFDSKEKDKNKILKAINKKLGTKITLDEIMDARVAAAINKDVKMGEDVLVQGTPTIFVDGKIDKSRYKYDKLIK